MTKFGRTVCDYFCGKRYSKDPHLGEVAPEVREASHRLSNAVMELKGSTANVQRHASAFLALVDRMQRKNGNDKT